MGSSSEEIQPLTFCASDPDSTLAYYSRDAAEYSRATMCSDMSAVYPALLDGIPAGGLLLDVGSGSGRDILEFLERGFRVEALDASPSLASLATTLTGVQVQVVRLEDWRPPSARYDGIWCFASLLHVARSELPAAIASLRCALKNGGWLFASFKRGMGDVVDERGRRFTNVTVEEARRLFSQGDLRVERVWHETGPALDGQADWLYVLAQRRR